MKYGQILRNLEEFLLHGVRYVFLPDRGQLSRGMPTAHAAPPLTSQLVPDPEGKVRGMIFSPLYKSAPHASRKDPQLYELLTLVDAIVQVV
jgi:hypothetical protein